MNALCCFTGRPYPHLFLGSTLSDSLPSPLHTVRLRGSRIERRNAFISWQAGGNRLAVGPFGGTVKLWSAATGEAMTTLPGHSAAVRVLAKLDWDRMVSGADDGVISVWDVAKGALLVEYTSVSTLRP